MSNCTSTFPNFSLEVESELSAEEDSSGRRSRDGETVSVEEG